MKTSNLYAIDFKDGLKGLIVAIGSAAIAIVQQSLQAGVLDFNWKLIGTVALSAGVSYLGKQFFTPASIKTPINS
jgi:hypothetical protein